MANTKQGNKKNNFSKSGQKPAPRKFYPAKEIKREALVYVDNMTIADIAEVTKIPVAEIIKTCFLMGLVVGQTQSIDKDTATLLANELKVEFKVDDTKDYTNFEKIEIVDDPKDLEMRPPVVTIMGHVDHGKTTLLDTIRNSRVVDSEYGGITQEIGAYQIIRDGKKITFIDTPGHAAFTEMRARGARITDIVVLVVAADDGVMPQTKEAIDHANASNCPIIVAINKIDKHNANPDRCMQELSEHGLLPEEWGGQVPFVRISALRGTGVNELLDTIQLVAEVQEYKANPNREATGYVVESELNKSKGPIATLIVKNGTLHLSDILVCGNTYAKIRAMYDDFGKPVKSAGPSDAVSIVGLNEVPQAGDKFLVINDEKKVKQISEDRKFISFSKSQEVTKVISLEEMLKDSDDKGRKNLKLVIKSDTSGTAEAMKGSLEKINVDGINLQIVRSSVGTITENDVLLAQASQAVIMGFNVVPLSNVKEVAKQKGVEIRLYNIIYKALEDVEKAMKGMLAPVYEDKAIGEAEVRQIFKVSKLGTIAGCYVTNGVIKRNSFVQVVREGKVIYEGKLSSLKRFKDDAKEVKTGFDCGLTIENFNDIKEGDILSFSISEEVPNEE